MSGPFAVLISTSCSIGTIDCSNVVHPGWLLAGVIAFLAILVALAFYLLAHILFFLEPLLIWFLDLVFALVPFAGPRGEDYPKPVREARLNLMTFMFPLAVATISGSASLAYGIQNAAPDYVIGGVPVLGLACLVWIICLLRQRSYVIPIVGTTLGAGLIVLGLALSAGSLSSIGVIVCFGTILLYIVLKHAA